MTVGELRKYLSYMNDWAILNIVIQGYEQFPVDSVRINSNAQTVDLVANQPAEPYNETQPSN